MVLTATVRAKPNGGVHGVVAPTLGLGIAVLVWCPGIDEDEMGILPIPVKETERQLAIEHAKLNHRWIGLAHRFQQSTDAVPLGHCARPHNRHPLLRESQRRYPHPDVCHSLS